MKKYDRESPFYNTTPVNFIVSPPSYKNKKFCDLHLSPSPENYGPFYRVSCFNFGNGQAETTREYIRKAIFSRCDSIRGWGEKSNDPSSLGYFLEQRELEIEFSDPKNSPALLSHLLSFFVDSERKQIEEDYKKLLPSERWVGPKEPQNFSEAKSMYHLGHLRPPWYLYKIYLYVSADRPELDPILYFGKVLNGSAIQYKLSNDAIECVREVLPLRELK